MMHDLKMGFTVMKYGLGVGNMVFALFVCLVASIFFGLFSPVGLSGLYLGMVAMLMAQLIFSVSVSTMVQTSPQKKRLQTTIPTLMSGMVLFLANTIHLFLTWIGYIRIQNNTNPFFIITMDSGELEAGILLTSGLMIFTTFYVFLSMKYFWLGTFLFVVGFFCGYYYFQHGEIIYPIMPTWLAVLLSYGMILVGCIIMYGISCVTYKRDYAKLAFETQLKRAG